MKRELPGEIVTRVVEGLLSTNLAAGPSPSPTHLPTGQPGPLDDRLTEALERDYAARYERLLQRSVFSELHNRDEFAPLASELLETKGAPSSYLRRKILLRASRSASIHGATSASDCCRRCKSALFWRHDWLGADALVMNKGAVSGPLSDRASGYLQNGRSSSSSRGSVGAG